MASAKTIAEAYKTARKAGLKGTEKEFEAAIKEMLRAKGK